MKKKSVNVCVNKLKKPVLMLLFEIKRTTASMLIDRIPPMSMLGKRKKLAIEVV